MFLPAFQRQPRAKDQSQFLRTAACSLFCHSQSCLATTNHQPNVHTHLSLAAESDVVTYMIGQTATVYVYIGAKCQFSVQYESTTTIRFTNRLTDLPRHRQRCRRWIATVAVSSCDAENCGCARSCNGAEVADLQQIRF